MKSLYGNVATLYLYLGLTMVLPNKYEPLIRMLINTYYSLRGNRRIIYLFMHFFILDIDKIVGKISYIWIY